MDRTRAREVNLVRVRVGTGWEIEFGGGCGMGFEESGFGIWIEN